MPVTESRQRQISALLMLGACVLIFHAYSLLAEGAREVLVSWVFALLVAELVLDIAALMAIARWFVLCNASARTLALRVTALAVTLHALRVAIFALGRIGPWIDFDVRPAARAEHADRWTWGDVWFASVPAIVSVVVLIWYWRRRSPQA